MRHITLLTLLLPGFIPAASSHADWLVIESNTARFAHYQLLEQEQRLVLAPGDRLRLLDDAGSSKTVEGPGTVQLGSRQRSSGGDGKTAAAGLASRLATLLAGSTRSERPGTSRGTGAVDAGRTIRQGTLDINGSERRCVPSTADLALGRSQAQRLATAQVEISHPGAAPRQLTWYPGFETITLTLGDLPDGNLEISVRQGPAPAKQLRISVIPATLAVAERLERMLAAGCTDDLAGTLQHLAAEDPVR